MQHLILLHGAIGAKDQLQVLADELSNEFIVHNLGFIGHGGEPLPREAFSIELFANVILLQFMWIIVLGVTLIVSYRRGVAYLTVNGG